MSVTVEPLVRHAPPPPAVVRLTNAVMGILLRTPLSRLIRPLSLLEFAGRRTGRRRRVVVGWHHVNGAPLVVTPASWRSNFAGGRPAVVWSRGRKIELVGTLTTDPHVVAGVVNELLHSGTSPGLLALRMPAGHTVTVDDVIGTCRAIIRFEGAARVV